MQLTGTRIPHIPAADFAALSARTEQLRSVRGELQVRRRFEIPREDAVDSVCAVRVKGY